MNDETPDILTSSPSGEPSLQPDAVRAPAAGKKKRGKAGAKAATAAIEARIGHRFADPALLATAVTHVSALKSARKRGDSYQRLEFLGDHVLGLIVSDMLYRAFPNADEGELSKRLADTFHDHHELSLASMHAHLDHDSCMEVTILRGRADKVRHFAEHVIAERGVRHGRVMVVPTDALAKPETDTHEPHGHHPHSHSGGRQRRSG